MQFTQRFDMLFYDLLLRSRSTTAPSQILLVSIDDRSLEEVGPWPWSRETDARLLEKLAEGRPRAIALDLLLIDHGHTQGDEQLAVAIAKGRPTYLPILFRVPGKNGSNYDAVGPVDAFAKSAAGLGHVSITPDSDGIVRRVFLDIWDGRRNWPHLMSLLAGIERSDAIEVPRPVGALNLEARRPVLIGFSGPQGSFPTVSASNVLRGEVPSQALAGRLVLVGVTASGIGDVYATPVTSDRTLMPGLEVQANLLNSMLSRQLVHPAQGLATYIFALAPVIAMLLALRSLSPRSTIWVLSGITCLLLVGTVGLLQYANLWIGPGSALLGLGTLYPLWNWRRLAAVSAYIADELAKLEGEHDPLERARPDISREDFVGRQVGLLRSAINRERDMRRFLVDRIAQMPDAMLVTDMTGKIVIANQAARQLWQSLGGKSEPESIEVMLKRLSVRAGLPPSDHLGLRAWEFEIEVADGRNFAVRSEPQHAADETTIGTVVRIADTTEARLAQRHREDVLQFLSHDMRSPQVSILTLLDSQEAAGMDPTISKRLRASATRTLRLADGFVQLARAQSLRFEPQPVDMADVAQEAADSLWPQARARGIKVICKLPEAELCVLGDRSLLTRMMVNLIDNAVRYSPPSGHVEVEVKRSDLQTAPACIMTVTDRGAGMTPARIEQLFQPYNTGSNTPYGLGGVGLGLAFVQAVVARHAGKIMTESQLGDGTRFILSLPLFEDFDQQFGS